jgi:16S rRNA (uracil1498-N3)-methyltransferase
MIRLYVQYPLQVATDVVPTPDQARYLTTVMRQSVGDVVALFNGRDGEWLAKVVEVSKRGCRLSVERQTRLQDLGPDLELIIALVKRTRLETIIEKATELGARRIRLALTRYTNADHTNVTRLQAIAVEAAEQTGRLDVPEVVAPEKLDQILAAWPAPRGLMFCDEAGDARPVLQAMSGIGGVDAGFSVLIGPEGGFAPEERERLRALAFVTPVSLGPRILRADTAAISALTLWQTALGDWRTP